MMDSYYLGLFLTITLWTGIGFMLLAGFVHPYLNSDMLVTGGQGLFLGGSRTFGFEPVHIFMTGIAMIIFSGLGLTYMRSYD